MKKAILLFLLSIVIETKINAQYFNINLGRPNPYIEYSYPKPLIYQDSLWLINLDVTRYLPGNYAFYPSIIIINNKGEFKKEIYPTDTIIPHYYADWLKKNESEYDIVGTEYDSNSVGSFFLLKLNSDLSIKSKNTYKLTRDIGDIKKLRRLPNGNLAFCGLIENYDKINKKYEEQQAVFFLIDSLGNELWHIEYGDSINNENFFDFAWDADYNFYIVGQWLEPYIDADFQSLIIKINSKGKIIWEKLFGQKDELNFFSKVNWIPGNRLICFGGYGPNGFNITKGGLQISVIDTLGNKIFNKNYFSNDIEPYDCIQDKQNNFICAGQTSEPDGKYNSGFIAKISQTGDTIWTHNYPLFIGGKRNIQVFYGINNTSDGGFILTGSTFKMNLSGIGNNSQAWVVKVDSLGFDHTALWPVATHETEDIQENNIISFFPNPTSGELFYRWKDLAPIVRDRWVVYFYDLQGKLVFTHSMSINTNNIMLQSLAVGVYPYVIKDSKNAFIKSGKVVVQKRY